MTFERNTENETNFEIINFEDIGNEINSHIDYTKSTSKNHKSLSIDEIYEISNSNKNNIHADYPLNSGDFQNLKYYLKKHSYLTQPTSSTGSSSSDEYSILNTVPSYHHYNSPNSTFETPYYDATNDFYSGKIHTDLDDAQYKSLPLTDVYHYHHHHRHHHQRHEHIPRTPDGEQQTIVAQDDSDYAKYLLNEEFNLQEIQEKAIVPPFVLDVVTCGMQKDMRLPIPKENYSLHSGEFGDDAGFTAQRSMQHYLGIADGAGGNKMYGFNPKLFSNSLMKNCSSLFNTGNYSVQEPKKLLCNAFDYVQDENCYGSSTACLVGVDCSTARLYSVNIGDSGYVILRNGKVLYRSRSQKMNGDCPRQLDVYPWTAALKQQGLNYTQISSLDAICQSFQLTEGDIVILSTDGLFDNVHDDMLERIVSNSHSLSHAATQLVNQAVRFYLKPDDILIIIARIQHASIQL